MECEFLEHVIGYNYSPRFDKDYGVIPISERVLSSLKPYICGFCGCDEDCKCEEYSVCSACNVMITRDEFPEHKKYTLKIKKMQTEKSIKEFACKIKKLGDDIKELGDNIRYSAYSYYIGEIQELQTLLISIKEELCK
jgi:hypothetical protein